MRRVMPYETDRFHSLNITPAQSSAKKNRLCSGNNSFSSLLLVEMPVPQVRSQWSETGKEMI